MFFLCENGVVLIVNFNLGMCGVNGGVYYYENGVMIGFILFVVVGL